MKTYKRRLYKVLRFLESKSVTYFLFGQSRDNQAKRWQWLVDVLCLVKCQTCRSCLTNLKENGTTQKSNWCQHALHSSYHTGNKLCVIICLAKYQTGSKKVIWHHTQHCTTVLHRKSCTCIRMHCTVPHRKMCGRRRQAVTERLRKIVCQHIAPFSRTQFSFQPSQNQPDRQGIVFQEECVCSLQTTAWLIRAGRCDCENCEGSYLSREAHRPHTFTEKKKETVHHFHQTSSFW